MSEGEFEKQVRLLQKRLPRLASFENALLSIIEDAQSQYPKVSQKYVPVKGKRIQWKQLCMQMEQKIIEFENFGKKWFGVGEKANAESQKKDEQK